MTQQEIKNEAAALRAKLTAAAEKGEFIFEPELGKDLRRLSFLQDICHHTYAEDGFCIDCGCPKDNKKE